MATISKTGVRAGDGISRRGLILNLGHMIPRVSAEELNFAMGVACAAAALRGPYPTPSKNEFTILDDGTGQLTTYRFGDSAAARAGFAVMEQFKEQPGKGDALLMRWVELTRLIDDQRMQPYLRNASDGSDAVYVRPEVIEIAAELPFDRDMGFNAQEFFGQLKVRVANPPTTQG
jgi:hypothetical protein